MRVETAFAFCRDVARREAKNFYWAFRVLPRAKSDAMCAVYAFMRRADDIADDESMTVEERRAAMGAWLESWRAARAAGRHAPGAEAPLSGRGESPEAEASGYLGALGYLGAEGGAEGRIEAETLAYFNAREADPVFVALGETQRRFGIGDELLEDLVRGTAMDLEEGAGTAVELGGGLQGYRTFEDLYRYCYLVASVVGLVCIKVFGYSDPAAEKLAERTGIAFQLTNILRDVKEDAERKRIYLPQDLLAKFAVTNEDVLALAGGRALRENERAMMAALSAGAWEYYASAAELLPLIDAESRAALWVMVGIYSRLLRRVDRLRGDVFSTRARVPTAEKMLVLTRGAAMAARVRMR